MSSVFPVRVKSIHSTQPNRFSFEGVVAEVPGAVVLTDSNGDYFYANQAFLDLSGYANISELKHVGAESLYVKPERRREFLKLIEQDGFVKDFEYELKRKDGSVVWVSTNSKKRIVSTDSGIYVSALFDISERKKEETEIKKLVEELNRLTVTDDLTGIYNLRGLNREGERELEHAKRFGYDVAVLMLDLDHFKKVNDTYGHPVGDLVLKHFVKICREHLRSVDTIGRYGGEEFVIISPLINTKGAVILAERLRKSLGASPIEFSSAGKKQSIKITTSIGIADLGLLGEPCKDLENMISCADKALYEAKKNGRNCTFICSIDPKTQKVILSPSF